MGLKPCFCIFVDNLICIEEIHSAFWVHDRHDEALKYKAIKTVNHIVYRFFEWLDKLKHSEVLLSETVRQK